MGITDLVPIFFHKRKTKCQDNMKTCSGKIVVLWGVYVCVCVCACVRVDEKFKVFGELGLCLCLRVYARCDCVIECALCAGLFVQAWR
jgi:hypothetical protein